ncbi:MAG: hypothetical protein LBC82_02380 [Oscillospiraceae bacterium]|jgi:uncharacterized membrane protein YraQ (UPF0718 family)|nr:hypothetical protein [Oscillospiraceae bacterium]
MTVIPALFVLILVAAAALAVIALVSAGLLSVFVALGCIAGVLRNVASDLAPPAMLFAGLFGIFSALALCAVLYILCPKAVRRFNTALDNIFD